MGKPVKRTAYPVFLTQIDVNADVIADVKSKITVSRRHFLANVFFCLFKSSKLSNQNQWKIPKPKQIGAYYKF